jgi:amino acid adenylation domain-containing protein
MTSRAEFEQVPSATSVVDWLDSSALRFKGRTAIEDSGDRSICYGDLAAISRAVQARLMAEGIRPGEKVGILIKKSIDFLVAAQAVLRTGGAYVPTDPTGPQSRAAFILNDCEARAVFVDEELAEGLRQEFRKIGRCPCLLVVPVKPAKGTAWRIEALADHRAVAAVPRSHGDLAFLLYTSGSTGKPKAVTITHGNVIAFVDWCSTAFGPGEQDKFATQAPLHYSLPVFQLYVAWKHGGAVVLIDEQSARTPQLLAPLIEKRGITVWFSTPTILSLLADSGLLSSLNLAMLRLVMFAGEPFPIHNLRSLRSQLLHPRYVHVLGSTETHIMSHYDLPSELPQNPGDPIPVGRVCAHFRSRLVDEELNDVPTGSDGELCLAGPGVTPGYWNAEEETAHAFFIDIHGEKWYRTGDIVRLRPDGNLIHRGRCDRMIKKRGNRVELAEIEACLHYNPGIKEAAVVATPDAELGLKVKAFVVPKDGARPTIIDLKAHCAKSLPQYMVPDVFALRKTLPRTSTGKIDFPKLKTDSV